MSSEFENDLWDREDLYQQQLDELQQQETEDMYEEEEESALLSDFDDEDFNDLLDDVADESLIDEARGRLEQARLYELLLEHNLFDGVDAIPQVVERVQEEIKSFIEERYLILSGMKQEKTTEVHVVQDSKFNDMEVQALKMIASKVTKGASVGAPTSEPTESELNTVQKKPKSNKINALGKNTGKTKAKHRNKRAVTPKPATNVASKKPIAKKKPVRKVKQEVVDKTTKGKSVNELVKKDMKYIKSLENMSLEEAGEVVAQRHPNRISKNAPVQDQVNAHYQTKMSMNKTASTFATLLAAAKKD